MGLRLKTEYTRVTPLQVYKCQLRSTNLIASCNSLHVCAGTGPAGVQKTPMQWAYTSDESVAFGVDCVLQGDLLLRGRHLGAGGERVSMFRAAFHTGYVPCGVLRLGRAQLDGACDDARFDQVHGLAISCWWMLCILCRFFLAGHCKNVRHHAGFCRFCWLFLGHCRLLSKCQGLSGFLTLCQVFLWGPNQQYIRILLYSS